MTGQDTARAYLALCAEWDWTPSPEGLDAWFRLWKGGYLDKWRSRKEPIKCPTKKH